MDEILRMLDMYEHNIDSYMKVKEAFDFGEKIVGIVHATGTGKTYNALALCAEHKDEKILYVVPSSAIADYIKTKIDSLGEDGKKYFSNLKIVTYQSLVYMDEAEMDSLDYSFMILDEFHHIGAPVWGDRIDYIIKHHPEMKIFGMTAYTVRDRGTSYERDMACTFTDELFSNHIVSSYDLCDAFLDEVLPLPIYRSVHVKLDNLENIVEKKLSNVTVESSLKKKYLDMVEDAKRRIVDAKGVKDLVLENVLPDGKYIYFCPPISQSGKNDIDSIMAEAREWFKEKYDVDDVVFYKTTSEDDTEGKKNRDAFYNDVDLDGKDAAKKLRVMFAINQYNEGVHAPNLDGVIMGRGTSSDIVFFEQLGRGLSTSVNRQERAKQLNKLTNEELLEMMKKRKLIIGKDMTREDMIAKLVAPVIIDLTDNYEFMRELENQFRCRLRERREKGNWSERSMHLGSHPFDIVVENQEIYDLLIYLKQKLFNLNWDSWFELAEKYYKAHGDLLVESGFKTFDGEKYDENGFNLGDWISRQRRAYKARSNGEQSTYYGIASLTDLQVMKLKSIGMVFDYHDSKWQFMYDLAQKYYISHKNLNMTATFKTLDGVKYNELGYSLGDWVRSQRANYRDFESIPESKRDILDSKRYTNLKEIGMVFEKVSDVQWNEMYALAKAYYEHYKDLLVPANFTTNDGINYIKGGKGLGNWIRSQRKAFVNGAPSMTDSRKKLLEDIGMVFDIYEKNWEEMYKLASIYYKHHKNLDIPTKFKTKNGYEFNKDGVNLGTWITTQRETYANIEKVKLGEKVKRKPLSEEQVKKLRKIGMIFDYAKEKWAKMYALATMYYESNGHLCIPANFKTVNGYEENNGGEQLGQWIHRQKRAYVNRLVGVEARRNVLSPLTDLQVQMLKDIGIIFSVRENNLEIMSLCSEYDVDYKKYKSVLCTLPAEHLRLKFEFLKKFGHEIIIGNELNPIVTMSFNEIQNRFGVDIKNLLETFEEPPITPKLKKL